MSRPTRFAITLVACVAVLVVAVGSLVMIGQAVRGPTPYDPQGLRRLRAIAASSEPLIEALARYRKAHGTYPPSLGSLVLPSVPAEDWYYTGSRDHYMLYYKLSWDPGLRFEYPTPGEWVYDPGNGNPKVRLSDGIAPEPGR